MVTLISGLLLIIALTISKFFYRKYYFNPAVVFFALWFFVLLLYELDSYIGFFYVRLSPYAEILFIESFLFFLIGSLTIALPLRTNYHRNFQPSQESYQLNVLYKITKFLFLIFLVTIFYKYLLLFQKYGNPFTNLMLIRAESCGEFSFSVLLRFLSLSGYLVILNLGILVVFCPNKKTIFLTLLTLILSFLNAASIGGRGSAFIVGLFLIATVLTAAIIKYRRIKLKFLFVGIAAIISCLLLLTIIVYLRSDKSISLVSRFVTDSYLYIVGAIPATSFFLDYPWSSRLIGYNIIAGIYQLVNLASNNLFQINFLTPQDLQTFYAQITTIGPFNTASYITYYYSDFGEMGVIILSYLSGIITTFLFFRAIYYRRIIDIQLSAIAMVYILISPRGVLTNGMNFWVILAALLIQHHILSRYQRRLTAKLKSNGKYFKNKIK